MTLDGLIDLGERIAPRIAYVDNIPVALSPDWSGIN